MPRGVAPGEQGYTPEVMPEDLPRKLTPEFRGGDILGPTLEHFAGTLGQKLQRDSAAWAGSQLAAARVKAVSDLETAKANAPTGDPGNFTEKYLTAFDKSTQPLIEQASRNPYAASMVNKGLTELRTTLADHTLLWEAQQRVAYRNDAVDKSLQTQLPIVEAHPELATSVGSTLMDQINGTGAAPAERLRMGRLMHEQLSMAAANGLARQDPKGVIEALNNPDKVPEGLKPLLDLNDQQRETLRARAGKQLVETTAADITHVYASGGTTAGVKALNAIDSRTDIPDELKAPLRSETMRQVNELRQQRREQYADQVANLEVRIGTGKADATDIGTARMLFERSAASPLEYASWRRGIANSIEAAVDDQANLKAARDAYQKGLSLDPQNDNAKKGVDQLFQEVTTNSKPGTPDYTNRAVELTSHLGVVPKSSMDWARTALNNAQPQEAAAAADLVARLNETNPRALGFGYEKEIAMAAQINGAIRSGANPIVAVDNARKIGEMPKVETDEFRHAWREQHADDGQASALHQALKQNPLFKGGFFSSVPNIPAPLQSDFDDSTKRYFQLTGDLKQARDLAAKDVQRVWGVSEVNGYRQIMQYPPEAYGFSTQDIRTHLSGLVQERAASFNVFNPKEGQVEPAQNIKADQLRLEPTEGRYSTARSEGRYWQLSYPDSNGHFQAVYDKDGQPLIYALPLTDKDFEKIRGDQHAQAVAQAREYRAELNEPFITGP